MTRLWYARGTATAPGLLHPAPIFGCLSKNWTDPNGPFVVTDLNLPAPCRRAAHSPQKGKGYAYGKDNFIQLTAALAATPHRIRAKKHRTLTNLAVF